MPIQTDEELVETVSEVGRLLQEIQDYAKRDFTKPARIRFPRGYLRTAAEARRRLQFLEDTDVKSNIAYTMQLSDVQHWILVRTDLSGLAKEMVIKLQVFLLGSIIETITKVHLKGKCGGNFVRRTRYLVTQETIDEELKVDLDWIWELRNRMHLFDLDQIEWLSTDYTVVNHNRAVRAFKKLLEALNNAG